MTPEQKEELIAELINTRRARYGFGTKLKPNDPAIKTSISYLWARDNIEIFEKFIRNNGILIHQSNMEFGKSCVSKLGLTVGNINNLR